MFKLVVGSLAGAIAGYIVMAIFIIATFAVSFPALGIDRLFAPGTYEASTSWIVLSLILGVAGAMLGGWVAGRVSPKSHAVQALAGLVLVFGLFSAQAAQNEDVPRGGPRGPEATMNDVMAHARQPTWITFVNPLLGAAGVLLGGRRRR
jgi:uncharacterized membrane protein YeaQ/YmgE (transglycosylase-associated protein family)